MDGGNLDGTVVQMPAGSAPDVLLITITTRHTICSVNAALTNTDSIWVAFVAHGPASVSWRFVAITILLAVTTETVWSVTGSWSLPGFAELRTSTVFLFRILATTSPLQRPPSSGTAASMQQADRRRHEGAKRFEAGHDH